MPSCRGGPRPGSSSQSDSLRDTLDTTVEQLDDMEIYIKMNVNCFCLGKNISYHQL